MKIVDTKDVIYTRATSRSQCWTTRQASERRLEHGNGEAQAFYCHLRSRHGYLISPNH